MLRFRPALLSRPRPRFTNPKLVLKPGHPRLWLTPAGVPDFRHAARTYRRSCRDFLLQALEPQIADVATVRRLTHDYPDTLALALGQAWRLTGDERYPRAALWLLEGLWTYPISIRNDYDVWGVTAETAALLYDWMHDYWQATGQARRIAEATLFCTRQALTYFLDMYIVDDWHNYGLGLQAGALAGALALGHDFPDLDRGELLRTLHALQFTGFAYGRTRLQDVYTTPRTRMCLQEHLQAGGGLGFYGHQEATGGYHNVDSYELVKMAEYWTSALEPPRGQPDRLVWPEMERIGEALLQFLRPDLCNFAWGDSRPWPGPRTRIGSILYHLNARRPQPVFSEFLRAFGRPRHLSTATHALLRAPVDILRAQAAGHRFDRAVQNHGPLSTWLDPLAVLRSGWDRDATHVTFRIGRHGGGHNHFDHNSFTIFRGGPLALDTGWVDYTHRSRTEYGIRTLAHNTLLVRNPREPYWLGRHAQPTQNDGGQRLATCSYRPPNIDTGNPHAILTEERREKFRDEFDMGRLLQKEFHPDFDYLAGDATRAYTYPWSGVGDNPSRRVEEFVRQLVFLKPDLLVIFDRVEATRAEFEKIWLLHTQGDPVAYDRGQCRKLRRGISNLPMHSCVAADCERGRLTVWPLLPAAQRLRVIGGTGYETWIDHPAPPDPAGGCNFSPPKGSVEVGRWRLELRPRKAAKRDYFLTVLHAGLRRDEPARNRYEFQVEETVRAVSLTIEQRLPRTKRAPNDTMEPFATLLFGRRGPVTVELRQRGAAVRWTASAPQRVPRAR